MLGQWYLDNLVCPRCRSSFIQTDDSGLICLAGRHQYPVIEGIPVLSMQRRDLLIDHYYKSVIEKYGNPAETVESCRGNGIEPYVNAVISGTCGNLYKHLEGRLTEYPIPRLNLAQGHGKDFLDIGCNWGRWSIAAARLGYNVIGIDPSLGALIAARRISRKLGYDVKYIVAEGESLPFAGARFDLVFSCEVMLHLSRENTKSCLREIYRVLKSSGFSLIQMPNKFGIRNIFQQLRRGLREPVGDEVRYWSPSELKKEFGKAIGKTSVRADCYFGLGIYKSDLRLMPLRYKAIIILSEFMRAASKLFPPVTNIADSLYLESIKVIR